MSTTNKEFFDLLNSITDKQTFLLELSPREKSKELPEITCKQLTTVQLKKLIETAIDSPLTQAAFNSTATKVFKDSIVESLGIELNVIDRLLFLIETRIQSFSQNKTVEHEGKTIDINFEEVKSKLKQQLKTNRDLISNSVAAEGTVSIEFGIPLLKTESQLNEELYKNINLDIKDTEELRKIVGEAFINEISKSIHTVTIQETLLDLSTISFKKRLEVIESLPASLIQKAVEYIEKYKKIIEGSLTVNNYLIPIDSTLFSQR